VNNVINNQLVFIILHSSGPFSGKYPTADDVRKRYGTLIIPPWRATMTTELKKPSNGERSAENCVRDSEIIFSSLGSKLHFFHFFLFFVDSLNVIRVQFFPQKLPMGV
jgi:hypothetical protein